MFDFREDTAALGRSLRHDLDLSVGCEGPATFLDLSADIARPFRSFLRCSTQGPSASALVDIQTHLELADRGLRDFELSSRSLFNVAFTLRALGLEVAKVQTSIQMIYDEIFELWTIVKSIDVQNYKIIKILTSVWRLLQDLKKNLYVMSRHQKKLIEKNLQPSVVSFSDYLQCSDNEELNSLLKSFSSKIMYFSETFRQIKYMNELLQNHQKLKSIHPLFSFQLILMINDPRISFTSNVVKSKSALSMLCPCLPKSNKQMLISEDPFLMNPDIVLNEIERQTIQIGTSIYSASREVKEVHCASLRREKIVLMDIQAKKMVLFKGFNELQSILSALSDADDCNDTLVGKMTKTRPLFKHINKYLKHDLSNVEPLLTDTIGATTNNL